MLREYVRVNNGDPRSEARATSEGKQRLTPPPHRMADYLDEEHYERTGESLYIEMIEDEEG